MFVRWSTRDREILLGFYELMKAREEYMAGESDADVVDILKYRKKDKETDEQSSFDDIAERNKRNDERMRRERLDANKKTLRNYNIKTKKEH